MCGAGIQCCLVCIKAPGIGKQLAADDSQMLQHSCAPLPKACAPQQLAYAEVRSFCWMQHLHQAHISRSWIFLCSLI